MFPLLSIFFEAAKKLKIFHVKYLWIKNIEQI